MRRAAKPVCMGCLAMGKTRTKRTAKNPSEAAAPITTAASKFVPSQAYLDRIAAEQLTQPAPKQPITAAKSSSSSDETSDYSSSDQDSEPVAPLKPTAARAAPARTKAGPTDASLSLNAVETKDSTTASPSASTSALDKPRTKKRARRAAAPSASAADTSAGVSLLRAFAAGGTSGAVNAFKRRELEVASAASESSVEPSALTTSQPTAAKPQGRVKGLPLSPTEKDKRIRQRFLTDFPTEFPDLAAASQPRLRMPQPGLATAVAKALPPPNEEALHGFWPLPPKLVQGKAAYPTTTTVQDDRPRVDIFVDNSNVVYSFLNWIRERPEAKVTEYSHELPGGRTRTTKAVTLGGKKVKMDYEVLFSVAERGRRVGRRCLVGSSPVWQDLSVAVEWVSREASAPLLGLRA